MRTLDLDSYRMDQHKLYWHLDRVNQWLHGDRIAPLHIDLGISSGCNMGCKYCYGVLQGRKSAANTFNMPREALLRFLKDAKDNGVRSIAFIGEGENTLNPDLYDALDYAKEIALDVSLGTNGLAIRHDRVTSLLNSLVWLRFNISAATPDSFKTVHRLDPANFYTVTNNIRVCVEAKKKEGSGTTIGLQMVVIDENINDIVPLSKLGKELGVDYLVIKACSDTYDKRLKAPTDKYLRIEEIFKEAEANSDEDYSVIVKWSKLQNLGLKQYRTCYGTQFILAISATGDVFPCGHFFNFDRDIYLMGNIIDESFATIITSERYWEVQNKIQQLDVNCDCETNCRQHYINGFLDMLSNPPDHINFI